jgi:1-acyl-sn-glycerol-3-phosphate acyltransferase
VQLRQQRLLGVEVRGIEHVLALVEARSGVLITPNHASHADSYALYEAADRLERPFYFMTAWQVFQMASHLSRWMYQRYGCFSVDREVTDLWAFKRAVRILSEEPHPLVIFPEGDVYHLNDRVTPFREGTAAIALTAAKHAKRPIHLVPCAIKFTYTQDPTPELEAVMAELEERILWRPRTGQPLAERVYKFAEAALALKEFEHMHSTQQGTLSERVQRLIEHVLGGLERTYGLKPSGERVPERVKSVRRACLERLEELSTESNDTGATRQTEAARRAIEDQLEDIFFVVQLFSYPGDYVSEKPVIERVAETIDKFEEDVLGHGTARIRGTRRAVVEFGEPIDVRTFADGAAQPRKAATPLTERLQQAVQGLLDGINRGVEGVHRPLADVRNQIPVGLVPP